MSHPVGRCDAFRKRHTGRSGLLAETACVGSARWRPAGDDLLPKDVRVAGMMCELAQHLELQRPHLPGAASFDDIVG